MAILMKNRLNGRLEDLRVTYHYFIFIIFQYSALVKHIQKKI